MRESIISGHLGGVPRVNNIKSIVKVIYSNDRQNGTKNFSGYQIRLAIIIENSDKWETSLAHQRIIRLDVLDDSRSNILLRGVRLAAEHNRSTTTIQKRLQTLEMAITNYPSEKSRVLWTFRIKFSMSTEIFSRHLAVVIRRRTQS
jgi:hypothetical protein